MEIIAKQKRSFFQAIFGKKSNVNQYQGLSPVQLLNSYNNRIYNYNGNLYNDDTVRSCIDTIARHFSKMRPVHRLKGQEVNDNLNKLLTQRPNPYMSTYDFLYKTVTSLYMQNNAYVYIQRDQFGNILALYPVLYNQAELKENSNGDMFLEFSFYNGQKATEPIDNIIVLRRHYYENDFFGESNNPALMPVVNLLYQIKQGIINAIQNSSVLRGILKVTGMLQPKDLKEKQDTFKQSFLNVSNSGGVAVTDDTVTFTSLDGKGTPVIVDDKNIGLAKLRILEYFGISESLLKGDYDEDQWQSFYEAVLEPLAIQFAQEFTAKLFTTTELSFGNEVIFETDRLAYMNVESKIDLVNSIKDLGIVTKGALCDILNLDQPPDADKIMQSLNYIDSSIANNYQLQALKDGDLKMGNQQQGGDKKDDKKSKSKRAGKAKS